MTPQSSDQVNLKIGSPAWRENRKAVLPYRLGGVAVLAVVLVGAGWYNNNGAAAGAAGAETGRALLSSGDCDSLSPPTPEWAESALGTAVYVFGCLYTFLGLAMVCDDYFVSALEAIVESLGMSEDVAGATFMAMGSSAPELFTALVATLGPNPSEAGAGTIVGSAIFNVLVIIGATAVLSGSALKLDWRPLTRDSSFYALSILLLLYAFSTDGGAITLTKSIVFLVGYALYIALMFFNSKLMSKCEPKTTNSKEEAAPAAAPAGAAEPAKNEESVSPGDVEAVEESLESMNPKFKQAFRASISELTKTHSLESVTEAEARKSLEGARRASMDKDPLSPAAADNKKAEAVAEGGADDEDDGPKNPLQWLTYVLNLPYEILFKITIPDCRKPQWKKWYAATFGMSIVWIGLLSWYMVDWATRIGCNVGISSAVMGLTFLAAGTSVPDALSSVLVAKNGLGDMAVSNAIGSNVFDVLLGLGLPWFLYNVINGEPPAVDASDIGSSVIILFLVLVLLFVVISLNGWVLESKVGYVLFTTYALYVAYALLTAAGLIDLGF